MCYHVVLGPLNEKPQIETTKVFWGALGSVKWLLKSVTENHAVGDSVLV